MNAVSDSLGYTKIDYLVIRLASLAGDNDRL
jgi:hypothetical protein